MDPNSQAFADIARTLLEKSRLDAHAIDSRLDQALDIDYWRALNPELTIEGPLRADLESAPLSDADIATCVASLDAYGYFKMPPVIAPQVLQQMVKAIHRLAEADWPATFGYVYDEFWAVTRTTSAVRLLEAVLGRGFKQNSSFWAHHVHPRRGSAGWRPHFDGRKGMDRRLSLWLPLTHATVDNGCMYLIPRDRVSERLLGEIRDRKPLALSDVELMLQGSYALPALAGSLMGWGFDVMHWGSTCTGDAPARISLAVEFLAADTPSIDEELPLFEGAGALPPFAHRIRATGSDVVRYSKFEPMMIRFRELAAQIAAKVKI